MVYVGHAQQVAGISVLLSMGLWNATACLISSQREQLESYRTLNKDNGSSERQSLSNTYRISWIIAKPDQVFYSLVSTHFFPPLPGDALEWEGRKQPCVTAGDHKRDHVPETDQVGNCFQGSGWIGSVCPYSKLAFPYCSPWGTPVSSLLREPKPLINMV